MPPGDMPLGDQGLWEAGEYDESPLGENEATMGVAPDGDQPPIPGVMLAFHGVPAGLMPEFRPPGLAAPPKNIPVPLTSVKSCK